MTHRGLILSLIITVSACGAVAPDIAGSWQSVDFVQTVDQFAPAQKSWQGDLFLKDFQCDAGGGTSLGWTCADGWATHRNGKTRYPYYIKELEGETYLFLPWLSGDVTERGMEPHYYVLRKVSSATPMAVPVAKQAESQKEQPPASVEKVEEYDDVRSKDLSAVDFSSRPNLVATLTFNEKNIWPRTLKITAARIMEAAKNPGLGVRQLHAAGVTGKGVTVAIIDQPLFQDHPEYAGKIAAYLNFAAGPESSMHGPAVASLLVGTTCGTAPDARLYYVAVPSWLKDAEYYANALDWIVEQNARLPQGEKIRVVSVSAAPSSSVFEKNTEQWHKAVARAEADGMMVLDCTQHYGFIGPCYYDASAPNNVEACTPGFPGKEAAFGAPSDRYLLVPSSPRTTAEVYNKGDFSYQYCGRGGLSWSIPYAAGVLAMGWQLRPDMTASEMRQCLFDSAFISEQGYRIINPEAFVDVVRAYERTADEG